MNNQIPERILRKINALKAMAADTSSENEAMIAARQLHAMLAKYNISMMDIEEEKDIARSEFDLDHRLVGNWGAIIAHGLAQLYFCKMYSSKNGLTGKDQRRTITIVGSNTFRDTALFMCESIINVVDREAKMSSKSNRPEGVDGWSYQCAFRNSASQRIYTRCMDLIEEGKKGTLEDSDGSFLPVLASMYDREFDAIEDFLSDMKFGKDKSRSQAASAAGRRAGSEFGDSVGLHRGVGETVKQRLIG